MTPYASFAMFRPHGILVAQPASQHNIRLCVCRWQGGTRVTAFVTGGFIPPELRGTSNSAIMHVADWCESSSAKISLLHDIRDARRRLNLEGDSAG